MGEGHGAPAGEAELAPGLRRVGEAEEGPDGPVEDGPRQDGKEEADEGGIEGPGGGVCRQELG